MKTKIKTSLAAILLLISCEKQNDVVNPAVNAQSTTNAVTVRYRVGDTLGGGIVFYVDSTRMHGLIAAFQNQGRAAWYNGVFTVTGATGSAIGTGALNTKKIVASQKVGRYAASLCTTYRGGGNTDWFLPSKAELNRLYLNRSVLTGITDFYYWSSTEVDSTKAWSQNFHNGAPSIKTKGGQFYVRAIRSF